MRQDASHRVILVHGSHTGAWIWDDLRDELNAAGKEVIAVDLAGYGKHQHVPVSLSSNAKLVADAGAAGEGHVILVGHSMGGFAITEAASLIPDRVALLVYLSAFVPKSGETLGECASRDVASAIPRVKIVDPTGAFACIPQDKIPDIFFPHAAGKAQTQWASRFVDDPSLPPGDKCRYDEDVVNAIPAVYVECLGSKAISIGFQRQMQARRDFRRICPVEGGHMPMLEQPKHLSAILLSLLEDFVLEGKELAND